MKLSRQLCGLLTAFIGLGASHQSVQAGLLGYWNFDGPATATKAERLKDRSGNRFHGNDRNDTNATTQVRFNNVDVPVAPFLELPGNTNYCLDLTTTNTAANIAHPYVVMEGASGVQAGSDAVTSAGNAFNIGGSSAKNQPHNVGKLSVSLWFKGLPVDAWGNLVTKGGEGYGSAGLPAGTWEGWAVRKNNTNTRIAFTTRNFGALGGNGDGDPGVDYGARSGGTITPLFNNAAPTALTTTFTNNIGSGVWQHLGMVWDGSYKHWYVNGFHIRSETVGSGFAIGTAAPLVFGSDINPNTGAVNNARAGRVRLDEISVWDNALTPAEVEDLARGADPRKPLRSSHRPLDFALPAGNTTSYNSFYLPTTPPANATNGNGADKYQNAAGKFSGLILNTAAGNAVQSLVVTSAPDSPEMDPTSYELWGTNAALTSTDNSGGRAEGNNWVLLGAGPLSLPAARSADSAPIAITNAVAYTTYKIIFPTVASAKPMQVAEVKLFTSPDGTGAAVGPYANVRAVAEPSIPNGLPLSPSAVANAQGGETVKNVIDGATTKWLNYTGASSGFIVTPGTSTAQSLVLTVANDTPGRDPTSYQLYGTNAAITSKNCSDGTAESWTLIQQGRLNAPTTRDVALPVITLVNSTAYTSYKLVFPTNSGDTLFQLREAQLFSTTDGTGAGIFAPTNPIIAIAAFTCPPLSVGSYFAKYSGGALLPQGSAGTMGQYEVRVNGTLRRPDALTTGTNGTMYAGDSPVLYTRWGMSTNPTNAQYVAADYWIGRATNATQIDHGDPEGLGGTQNTGTFNNYLINRAATADDQFMQTMQGCFRVAAPGKYTFVMKGDDGAQLAIERTNWTAIYANNGAGSIASTHLQNGFPTGDTNNLAVVEFPAAGDYNFRYIWNEQGGGAFNEVFYANGELTAYDGNLFKQVGDPAGGLTLVDHAPQMAIRSSFTYVQAGNPTAITLDWDAAYATQVSVGPQGGALTDVTASTLNGWGSLSIPAPTVTTTYEVVGIRNGGAPVTATVTVRVNEAPNVVSFTVSDNTLVAGSPLTLNWQGQGGTTWTLTGGPAPVDVTTNTRGDILISQSGSITFPAPSATTTYTLTASNSYGTSLEKTVTVTVGLPPAVSLTADRTSLYPGSFVRLDWNAANGESATISPRLSTSSLSNAIPLTGFSVQQPAATTTYTVTAVNQFGSSIGSVTVNLPERFGVSASGWTVEANYWNRISPYLHPTVGVLNQLTQGVYQADLMLDLPDSAFPWDGTTLKAPLTINANATTNVLTIVGTHSLAVGSRFRFVNLNGGGGGISTATLYHVVSVVGNDITISLTAGGIPLDFTTDIVGGTGGAPSTAVYEMAYVAGAYPPAAASLTWPNVTAVSPTGPNAANTYPALARYRLTGLPEINIDDAAGASGALPAAGLRPMPSYAAGSTYDHYAIKATTKLVVNVPGNYTLGVGNDDGGRVRIDFNRDGDFKDAGEMVFQDETYKGIANAVSLPFTFTVELAAGEYPLEYTSFEAVGGGASEFFFVDTADNCRVKHLPLITTPLAGASTGDLVITEFMASNNGVVEDQEGDSPDWVEIYNGTAAPISLDGYFLTDSVSLPTRWAFPTGVTIPAGGYKLVFASGKATRIPPPPATELHTNFSLASDAGYLALTKSAGATVVSSYTYGNQRGNVSYGWLDGSPASLGYNPSPTPANLNMGGAAGLVRGDTSFSVDRGIKSAPFSLVITASDTSPGTVIRYTLDGSTPTATNGLDYTGPLNISTTTTIRARAMRSGALPTNVDTQTYVFPADVLSQNTLLALGRGWPNSIVSGQYFDFGMDPAIVTGNETAVMDALKAIPSVSLVTDITNLTDPLCGIFVESQYRGRAFERNVSVELLNDKGDLNGNFQIDAGIRSRGGFSRNDGNPKHSWHLYFRNDPGYTGRLDYPIYGSKGSSQFRQIDLATANNYSWSYSPDAGNVRNFNYTTAGNVAATYTFRTNTFIRDIASRDLQIQTSGYGTRNKYVHLYLNGLYWGLHYFQERAEASFGEEYFGGDRENYDVVKSAGSPNGYLTESTDGDYAKGLAGTATADGVYASAWSKLYNGAYDLRNRNALAITQAAIDDRNVRFYRLMGMDYNPATKTATRNSALPVLLHVNDLVDYILITCYAGAYDAPLSTFLNNASNNWPAMRDAAGQRGFRYFVWDFEHGMGTDMMSGDLTTAVANIDVNFAAGTNYRNVFTTTVNTTTAGIRSTNRLGPWAVTTNVRPYYTSHQHFRGAFSTTNPEFYQNPIAYNNGADYGRSNPQYLHEFLAFSTEYRRLFADRAQCVLRQNGPLTTPRVIEAINARAVELENAVIAESARWGNAKGVALANYNKAAWQGAVQNIRDWVTQGSNQHLLNSLPIYEAGGVTPRAGTGVPGPGRAEVLISQLKTYKDGATTVISPTASTDVAYTGTFIVPNLFPGVDAPVFSNWGGLVTSGTNVTLTNPSTNVPTNQVIYYSLSGVDPRPVGGGAPLAGTLNVGSAGTTSGDVVLTATGTLVSRVYDSITLEWSALARADFVVGVAATKDNLVISEMNYNPADTSIGVNDGQNYEYIELHNVSASTVDLSGVSFTGGISYSFPQSTTLAAGARIVVARDVSPTGFESRYTTALYPNTVDNVYGPYTGSLDNGGEGVILVGIDGADADLLPDVIADFLYDDSGAWPDAADGNGSTLVFTCVNPTTADKNDPTNWFSHARPRGNPAGPDCGYSAFSGANSVSTDGLMDTDKDGLTDLVEYMLGTNPKNVDGSHDSSAAIPTTEIQSLEVGMDPPADYQTFTFVRADNTVDLNVVVETSPDLTNPSWQANAVLVSAVDNGDFTVYTYRAPQPKAVIGRLFMRARATITP